jgi:hypothetical protein
MTMRLLAAIALALGAVSSLAWADEIEVVPRDPEDKVEPYRDGAGLWRDTKYFLGYQFGAIAILYAMPESVSGWSDEQKKDYSLSVWWEKTTHPENDSDDFYINYILHPYWGASYFVRARERGYNNWQAFGYSALLSSIFEFEHFRVRSRGNGRGAVETGPVGHARDRLDGWDVLHACQGQRPSP